MKPRGHTFLARTLSLVLAFACVVAPVGAARPTGFAQPSVPLSLGVQNLAHLIHGSAVGVSGLPSNDDKDQGLHTTVGTGLSSSSGDDNFASTNNYSSADFSGGASSTGSGPVASSFSKATFVGGGNTSSSSDLKSEVDALNSGPVTADAFGPSSSSSSFLANLSALDPSVGGLVGSSNKPNYYPTSPAPVRAQRAPVDVSSFMPGLGSLGGSAMSDTFKDYQSPEVVRAGAQLAGAQNDKHFQDEGKVGSGAMAALDTSALQGLKLGGASSGTRKAKPSDGCVYTSGVLDVTKSSPACLRNLEQKHANQMAYNNWRVGQNNPGVLGGGGSPSGGVASGGTTTPNNPPAPPSNNPPSAPDVGIAGSPSTPSAPPQKSQPTQVAALDTEIFKEITGIVGQSFDDTCKKELEAKIQPLLKSTPAKIKAAIDALSHKCKLVFAQASIKGIQSACKADDLKADSELKQVFAPFSSKKGAPPDKIAIDATGISDANKRKEETARRIGLIKDSTSAKQGNISLACYTAKELARMANSSTGVVIASVAENLNKDDSLYSTAPVVTETQGAAATLGVTPGHAGNSAATPPPSEAAPGIEATADATKETKETENVVERKSKSTSF